MWGYTISFYKTQQLGWNKIERQVFYSRIVIRVETRKAKKLM